jgi:hypothetical protein
VAATTIKEIIAQQIAPKDNSLELFFEGIRESCNTHARRKGYTNLGADKGNVAGPFLDMIGVTQEHAIGEIALKLLEFRRAPRRVVAEKIAGWAWRLWCSCPESHIHLEDAGEHL